MTIASNPNAKPECGWITPSTPTTLVGLLKGKNGLVAVAEPGVDYALPGSGDAGLYLNVVDYGARGDGIADDTTTIQAALDAAGAMGGGVVYFPAGTYVFTAIKVPDRVRLLGAGWNCVTLKVKTGTALTVIPVTNKTTDTLTPALGAPGIAVKGIKFDGSALTWPYWLTKQDGTPITDPEADYLPGGCLSPPVPATASAVITDGVITAINIDTPGSGYVYPPTVWIEGDGVGFQSGNPTLVGDGVASFAILDGGKNYTAATLTVVGGGANPATALFNADRRNRGYREGAQLMRWAKTTNLVVEDCYFYKWGAQVITDNGGDGLTVRRCVFDQCGQQDFAANCLWTGSYSSVGNPSYRKATRPAFVDNIVSDCRRVVCTVGAERQIISRNRVDGCGETMILIAASGLGTVITDNTVKNVHCTDLLASFCESKGGSIITGNYIDGVDGTFYTQMGPNDVFANNTLQARPIATTKFPFSPFNERVGYSPGSPSRAGTWRKTTWNALMVRDSAPAANPSASASRIVNNMMVDPDGVYGYFLSFQRNNAQRALSDFLISGNDFMQAPHIQVLDVAAALDAVPIDKPIRVIDNMGHVSMGAMRLDFAVTAAGFVTHDLVATFGFRPRVVHVIYASTGTTEVLQGQAIFVDEQSRKPGTDGTDNTSGVQSTAAVTTVPATHQTLIQDIGVPTLRNAAGSMVFNTFARGFSHDGWSMTVTACSVDMLVSIVGIP